MTPVEGLQPRLRTGDYCWDPVNKGFGVIGDGWTGLFLTKFPGRTAGYEVQACVVWSLCTCGASEALRGSRCKRKKGKGTQREAWLEV